MLRDHPQGAIYVAWSGHSKTGRVQGMLVKPTAAKVEDGAAWERAMQWAMADFGFQNCPIFQTEIVGMEGSEGVSSVSPFQSLFCRNPGKNCRSREVFLCGSTQGVPVGAPIVFVFRNFFLSRSQGLFRQQIWLQPFLPEAQEFPGWRLLAARALFA